MPNFNQFSYGIYSLSGGTWTSNGVVSSTDLEFSEIGGSVTDELEVAETLGVANVTPGSSGSFQNLIYRGFFDSGTAAGRMYQFESTSSPGLFLFTSEFEVTTSVATGSTPYPSSFPDSSVMSSNHTYCFAGGTMIATPDGERAVQSLEIGDLVTTADGASVAVKWVGYQSLPFASMMPEHLEPVRIRAGALGGGLPKRDLIVSSDHGMMIDDMVVNAGGGIEIQNG